MELVLTRPPPAATIPAMNPTGYKRVWTDQCEATEGIRASFGVEKALEYLIGEKLPTFLWYCKQDQQAVVELAAFITEIRRLFTSSEIDGYLVFLRRTKYRGHSGTGEERRRFARIRELL